MAYYFMIETKNRKFKPLEIQNSKYFLQGTKSLKKEFAYKLPEIDQFTMQFDNEAKLRIALFESGELIPELFDKPLSIRLVKNNQYYKVPFEFLYKSSSKYISEPETLISYIIQRYTNGDTELIKRIARFFSKDRSCSSTAPEILYHLNESERLGRPSKYLERRDANGDHMIPRLLKLIILENYIEKYTGRIIYKSEIKYRNLHTLIALIDNYDKEKQQEQTNQEKTQAEQLGQPIYVKARVYSNKKYVLDDQMQFDI